MPQPFRISVLISGGGTTLKNLIQCRQAGQLNAELALVLSNRADARGLQFAREAGLTSEVVPHGDHATDQAFRDAMFQRIRDAKVDLVVMGGFLRRLLIPDDFENRVINIHPSLIPSFCGHGFYGRKVHQAVLDYGCKVSGCTVHFVDDHYDHGPIIAQSTVDVAPTDDAVSLAARVFQTECQLYPQVINAIAAGEVSVEGRKVHWDHENG